MLHLFYGHNDYVNAYIYVVYSMYSYIYCISFATYLRKISITTYWVIFITVGSQHLSTRNGIT